MGPLRQLVEVDHPARPTRGGQGGDQPVAPGEGVEAPLPVAQGPGVAAAVGLEPVDHEARGGRAVEDPVGGVRADDLGRDAELAQHPCRREQHHLAAPDLAVVRGEHDPGHRNRPRVAS